MKLIILAATLLASTTVSIALMTDSLSTVNNLRMGDFYIVEGQISTIININPINNPIFGEHIKNLTNNLNDLSELNENNKWLELKLQSIFLKLSKLKKFINEQSLGNLRDNFGRTSRSMIRSESLRHLKDTLHKKIEKRRARRGLMRTATGLYYDLPNKEDLNKFEKQMVLFSSNTANTINSLHLQVEGLKAAMTSSVIAMEGIIDMELLSTVQALENHIDIYLHLTEEIIIYSVFLKSGILPPIINVTILKELYSLSKLKFPGLDFPIRMESISNSDYDISEMEFLTVSSTDNIYEFELIIDLINLKDKFNLFKLYSLPILKNSELYKPEISKYIAMNAKQYIEIDNISNCKTFNNSYICHSNTPLYSVLSEFKTCTYNVIHQKYDECKFKKISSKNDLYMIKTEESWRIYLLKPMTVTIKCRGKAAETKSFPPFLEIILKQACSLSTNNVEIKSLDHERHMSSSLIVNLPLGRERNMNIEKFPLDDIKSYINKSMTDLSHIPTYVSPKLIEEDLDTTLIEYLYYIIGGISGIVVLALFIKLCLHLRKKYYKKNEYIRNEIPI